jgi:uncharacterized membrane protein HdeD (DUF308 family)
MHAAAHEHDEPFPGDTLAAVWREEIARHWKRFLAVGIACDVVGLFSVAIPLVASISVAVLAGWILLIGGGVQLGHGVRTRMWWRVLGAALAIVAGALILIFPLEGTISLTVVLVAWFWATGATRLVAWWETRGATGSWMLAANGILSIVLGSLIWADLPSSASWAIGLLVGIDLVFTGSALIMSAFAARRLQNA